MHCQLVYTLVIDCHCAWVFGGQCYLLLLLLPELRESSLWVLVSPARLVLSTWDMTDVLLPVQAEPEMVTTHWMCSSSRKLSWKAPQDAFTWSDAVGRALGHAFGS